MLWKLYWFKFTFGIFQFKRFLLKYLLIFFSIPTLCLNHQNVDEIIQAFKLKNIKKENIFVIFKNILFQRKILKQNSKQKEIIDVSKLLFSIIPYFTFYWLEISKICSTYPFGNWISVILCSLDLNFQKNEYLWNIALKVLSMRIRALL